LRGKFDPAASPSGAERRKTKARAAAARASFLCCRPRAGSGAARRSEQLQVPGRRSAVAAGLQFEADLLIVLQPFQARGAHRGDMDEHILTAIVRGDEAVALFRVEPFDGACGHRVVSFSCGLRAQSCIRGRASVKCGPRQRPRAGNQRKGRRLEANMRPADAVGFIPDFGLSHNPDRRCGTGFDRCQGGPQAVV